MALPASMTTAKSSSNTFKNDNNEYQSNKRKSGNASKSYGGVKQISSQNDRVDKRTGDDYDNEDDREEVEGDKKVEEEERRDIDDDEVLRILSLLDEGEEGEEEEEEGGGGGGGGGEIEGNGNNILRTKVEENDDEEDDDDYYEEERPIDPSKQLQQRLKGLYSRSKGRGRGSGSGSGSGRGSLIGDVVFDIVDNKGRVRDIRKSQLSDPPSPLKVSLFSSPLTELSGSKSNSKSRSEKSNIGTSYTSTAYQSGSNKKAGGTVADALEALKNPFLMPPKSRESSNYRGTAVTGIPGESIVSTNNRLRALATRPVGGSYEGEEVDRALR